MIQTRPGGQCRLSTQTRSPRPTATGGGTLCRSAHDDGLITAVERNLSCGNGLGLAIAACLPV